MNAELLRIAELENACRQALEALEWSWGGEPLPTLEIAAIAELKRVLAAEQALAAAICRDGE